MKSIAIITNKYPNPFDPNVLVFVQQLVWEMADQGIRCTVISPMPINISPKYLKLPYKTIETTDNGSKIEVYRPKYFGFGQSNYYGYNPAKITTFLFETAVEKTLRGLDEKIDVLYGHFLTPAGIVVSRIGKKYGIPSFMAYGESTYKTVDNFGKHLIKKEIENLSGVIAVSNRNKQMLLDIGVINESKVSIFPNGFRKERFYPRDKKKSREKFNLPQDKFIVSFVGSFDERKGIERLVEAVELIDDVYVICAGKGERTPDSSKCLYQGTVENKDLPYFNSAADIFVLPTLNEGSCNAIIEALACGIPVISSDLSFNDEILNENCSIRIDVSDVNEIRKSILELKNNTSRREKMAEQALIKSRELEIGVRAENITKFITEKM